MENEDSFYLCEEHWGSIQFEFIDGCLKVFVHIFSGPMEMERWYKFDKENTELFQKILVENKNNFKKYVIENFGMEKGYEKLLEFWNENNIKYEYNSWSSYDIDR